MSLHPTSENIHPGAYLSSCLPDIWVSVLTSIKRAAAKAVPMLCTSTHIATPSNSPPVSFHQIMFFPEYVSKACVTSIPLTGLNYS